MVLSELVAPERVEMLIDAKVCASAKEPVSKLVMSSTNASAVDAPT